MLFNCSHPSNKKITKQLINDTNISGQYFHRLSWLADDEIGTINHEYNWLVNWYQEPADGRPKILHYTEGGPWLNEYKNAKSFRTNLHTDVAKPIEGFKTGIFYLNSNDGKTYFEKGDLIDSVANRFVSFSQHLKHGTQTHTDTNYRIVINFNWYDDNKINPIDINNFEWKEI